MPVATQIWKTLILSTVPSLRLRWWPMVRKQARQLTLVEVSLQELVMAERLHQRRQWQSLPIGLPHHQALWHELMRR